MVDDQLAKIFRTEYSNLVAILCHFNGVKNIQLAEDLVSDTFLQAKKVWSLKGVPATPKAWLRKVAVNKLKDHYRRDRTFKEKVIDGFLQNSHLVEDRAIDDQLISDGLLNMMFAVCHSSIKTDVQICLALRLLCGFSIAQIAAALITNKENINKKLYRGKQKLKSHKNDWNELSRIDYISRIDAVLRIIYLLFNEGYYHRGTAESIRRDLCWEAMRLAVFMTRQSFLPQRDTYALLALMCFHASRFDARTTEGGQIVLFMDQDKSLWNEDLIKQGRYYLLRAANTDTTSKYHIEATIAYWHTTEAPDKWTYILQLYDRLLSIEYSPVIALNRTFALALAHTPQQAITAAKQLDLQEHYYYHCLRAELHRLDGDPSQEVTYLRKALALASNDQEKEVLRSKLSKSYTLSGKRTEQSN